MSKRRFSVLSSVLTLEIFIGFGLFFGLQGRETSEAQPALQAPQQAQLPEETESNIEEAEESEETEAAVKATVIPSPLQPIVIRNSDLNARGQLANPPETIKAVYLTSWSGGTKGRIDYIVNLAKTTDMNAVVIDIKDFSGQLAYDTDVPEAAAYRAEVIKIWNIEGLLKRLHEEGLYVIARVTVFQDPVLAAARPDLAVKSAGSGKVWTDNKALSWIDPASREAWNYTVAIARDAASRGFDEINFDYVRFPSDGDLRDMEFPFSSEEVSKRAVLREFFQYLREHLEDTVISADLFGLSTSSADDLGIGQVIEDAYEHFDYVYPMVYPSHYANGYLGYAKPAEYPYEVVHYSLFSARSRLQALRLANPEGRFAKLRPWLQDFDLGAVYGSVMVQAQVQASLDALGEEFAGFLLWAPTNYYTLDALKPFVFSEAVYQARPRSSAQEPE